jgi:GT2 family glycosyltransferase
VAGVSPTQARPPEQLRLAVVLHLFYPEYWSDFAKALAELPGHTDVFITTPHDKLAWVRKVVANDLPSARVIGCHNRGRDLGPLIGLLDSVSLEDYDYILKLHTKRSPHLHPGRGDLWRRNLLSGLLPRGRVRELLDFFEQHPAVGMAAPSNWLASLQSTPGYDHNRPLLKQLGERLGFDPEAADYRFAAGTMFWARGAVFRSLRTLGLKLDNFEVEAGQLDGTLAHALERAMPLLAFEAGLDILGLPQALADEASNPGEAPTLEAWLDARCFTPSQEEQVRRRLEAAAGTRLAVFVVDVDQPRARLETTLTSLLQAARFGVNCQVTVLSTREDLLSANLGSARVQHLQARDEWLAALNAQAAASQADWLLTVRCGDEFTPSGLSVLMMDLASDEGCRAVYTDEFFRGADGRLGAAFRPDFNLDLTLSFPAMMAQHWLVRRESFLELGGLREACGEAAEFDLLLRLVEHGGLCGLGHVAEPLLITDAPTAADQPQEREALVRHLLARGYENARVYSVHPRQYRIEYGHAAQPLVSIIIPTRDQLPLLQRCVESLIEKTRYPNYELLIVDNQSETVDARRWLDGVTAMRDERVRVLRYPHPFNFSAMNNLAARQARGDYLVLLNNDTAIIEPGWLDALLNHAQRPEVGAVGAKLLFPDGTVQHAGIVLGLRGPADHPFMGEALDAPGTMQRLQVDQNYSAVTAACLMIRKSVYQDVGGMDEGDFKVSYNDVDLCLKVRAAGYLNVWTPHAIVLHEGSVSQKQFDPDALEAKRERFAAEQDALHAKWAPLIANDPAYNRHLSLRGRGFEFEARTDLARPPLGWRTAPVVLAHWADRWGCGHYRMIQPFEAMRAGGHIEGALTDSALLPSELARLDPDVIVMQRQIGEQRLEAMRRIKAFSRAFKIYELDDYLPNLPVKSAYRAGIPKDAMKSLRRGLGCVDRFVVSTDALAEAFGGMHPDIRVVKNHLPAAWWSGLSSRRQRGRKPRVGWAGSAGHAGDLALIVDVIKALADEVEWVFFGMCPAEVVHLVHELHAGVPIEDYPAKLASLDLDLALAPLEHNLFNECKSNLRLLEYGACGFPVVCTDIRCYRDDALPVTRVKNRFKEWVDAIRMHTHDLEASARAGDVLRTAVHGRWMLSGPALDAWHAAWTET